VRPAWLGGIRMEHSNEASEFFRGGEGVALIAGVLTVLLTMPVCRVLLGRYHASISRGMRSTSSQRDNKDAQGQRTRGLVAAPSAESNPESSDVVTTSTAEGSGYLSAPSEIESGEDLARQAQAQVRRALAAYTVTCAGFAFTIFLAGHLWHSSNFWFAALAGTLALAWVALPIAASVSGLSGWPWLIVVVAWLIVALSATAASGFDSSVAFTRAIVVVQGALIALTSPVRFRGTSWFVAPTIFAMVAALETMWFAIANWIDGSDDGFGAAVGIGIGLTMVGILVAYLVLMVWLYERKRISDQGLLFRQWWVLCALAVPLANELIRPIDADYTPLSPDLIFILLNGVLAPVLTAFVLASLTTRRMRAESRKHAPRRLLLLRTFGHPGRSTRLLRDLTKWWRWIGAVELVTATDLAGETLEPDEFIDFLRGRTDERFVRDHADLMRRLTNLDLEPDRDGRFRVNEFLCRADSWEETVTALAGEADVILVDLRAFSAANSGVSRELNLLIASELLPKVVALTDHTTDSNHLTNCVTTASPFAQQPGTVADIAALPWTLLKVGSESRAKDAARVFEAVAAAAST
jgi:hypothetical protein